MSDAPPLPSRARFLRERAEKERESGVVWNERFNPLINQKLFDAIEQSTDQFELLERQVEGYLREHSHDTRDVQGISAVLLNDFRHPFAEPILDVLDATSIVLDKMQDNIIAAARHPKSFELAYPEIPHYDPAGFRSRANAIFVTFRINWVFVNGRLAERSDQMMHVEVVAPLEAVLTGKPEFAAAEAAYRESLAHLANGQPGAAITSASSTLQEVLRVLGAKGGDLNSLLADATRRGFLAKHDAKLNLAFRNIADWAVADRGNKGNAHWASTGGQDDAWLAVHIIGALIVRLAADDLRGELSTFQA